MGCCMDEWIQISNFSCMKFEVFTKHHFKNFSKKKKLIIKLKNKNNSLTTRINNFKNSKKLRNNNDD